MTVASINSTITVVVASELGLTSAAEYTGPIQKVSEALEAREYDIVDAIVDAAQGYAAEEDVRNILESAGLAVRPVVVPEPEVPVTANDVASSKLSKSERIAALEEGQATIISSLNALTELAKRHLGANL